MRVMYVRHASLHQHGASLSPVQMVSGAPATWWRSLVHCQVFVSLAENTSGKTFQVGKLCRNSKCWKLLWDQEFLQQKAHVRHVGDTAEGCERQVGSNTLIHDQMPRRPLDLWICCQKFLDPSRRKRSSCWSWLMFGPEWMKTVATATKRATLVKHMNNILALRSDRSCPNTFCELTTIREDR